MTEPVGAVCQGIVFGEVVVTGEGVGMLPMLPNPEGVAEGCVVGTLGHAG